MFLFFLFFYSLKIFGSLSFYVKALDSTDFGLYAQSVAVKQLDRNGLQGNKEFLVEVMMLSSLHHESLVSLIGYCADGDQRLLVYEFMPRGSLEDHLHGMIVQCSLISLNAIHLSKVAFRF